jgi:hypothetical protein
MESLRIPKDCKHIFLGCKIGDLLGCFEFYCSSCIDGVAWRILRLKLVFPPRIILIENNSGDMEANMKSNKLE